MAPIQFGILSFHYQALDTFGPGDILNSLTKSYLQAISNHDPIDPSVVAKAPEIEIHHIGDSLEPVALTAGVKIVPTTTVDDCPPLDYLLVGGGDPKDTRVSPRQDEFVRAHVAAGKQLFTTCTGALMIIGSGVLDGKNAMVNHQEYEYAKKMYPQVKWTKEKKWVVDGNIWTGGGAAAGMDMIAHWAIEKFGLAVAAEGFKALDFEPRDIDGNANVVVPKEMTVGGKVTA